MKKSNARRAGSRTSVQAPLDPRFVVARLVLAHLGWNLVRIQDGDAEYFVARSEFDGRKTLSSIEAVIAFLEKEEERNRG